MIQGLVIAFLFEAGGSGGAKAPRCERAGSQLPLVEGPGYKGVVFPDSRARDAAGDASYWTPTLRDVQLFEEALARQLPHAIREPQSIGVDVPSRPWAIKDLSAIVPQLASYRRQYTGIVEGDRRLLLARMFRREDSFPCWRHSWVVVRGGGTDFWSVRFDVKAGTFSDLWVNAPK